MSKALDLRPLTVVDHERAVAASDLLLPEQHHPDCPVSAGASVCCILPLCCCVFDEFKLLSTYEQEP